MRRAGNRARRPRRHPRERHAASPSLCRLSCIRSVAAAMTFAATWPRIRARRHCRCRLIPIRSAGDDGHDHVDPADTGGTRLVGAQLMSNLADGVRLSAFPLLVFALTASPVWVSAAFATGLVPSVLLGPLAGALADRYDRRRLLRTAAAARTVMLLALAATIAAGTTPIVLVLVVAALFGVGEAFADTTMAALVPTVIPHDRLDTVNGRMVGVPDHTRQRVGRSGHRHALFAVVAWLPFVSASGMLTIALVLVGGLSLIAMPAPVVETAPDSAAPTRCWRAFVSSPGLTCCAARSQPPRCWRGSTPHGSRSSSYS